VATGGPFSTGREEDKKDQKKGANNSAHEMKGPKNSESARRGDMAAYGKKESGTNLHGKGRHQAKTGDIGQDISGGGGKKERRDVEEKSLSSKNNIPKARDVAKRMGANRMGGFQENKGGDVGRRDPNWRGDQINIETSLKGNQVADGKANHRGVILTPLAARKCLKKRLCEDFERICGSRKKELMRLQKQKNKNPEPEGEESALWLKKKID